MKDLKIPWEYKFNERFVIHAHDGVHYEYELNDKTLKDIQNRIKGHVIFECPYESIYDLLNTEDSPAIGEIIDITSDGVTIKVPDIITRIFEQLKIRYKIYAGINVYEMEGVYKIYPAHISIHMIPYESYKSNKLITTL